NPASCCRVSCFRYENVDHQGQDLMFDLRRELPNQIFDEYAYDARAAGIRIVPERARYSPWSCSLINAGSLLHRKRKRRGMRNVRSSRLSGEKTSCHAARAILPPCYE